VIDPDKPLFPRHFLRRILLALAMLTMVIVVDACPPVADAPQPILPAVASMSVVERYQRTLLGPGPR